MESKMQLIPDAKQKIRIYLLALRSLSVYRKLLEKDPIGRLADLLQRIGDDRQPLDSLMDAYSEFFFSLASNAQGSLADYLIDQILMDENPFTRKASTEVFHSINPAVVLAACNDLRCLQLISKLTPVQIKDFFIRIEGLTEMEQEYISALPIWQSEGLIPLNTFESPGKCELIKQAFQNSPDWGTFVQKIAEFHYENGCGEFILYRALLWDYSNGTGFLRGIASPDPVRLSDLIGYQPERSEVISNTLQFLQGKPANNVLLYGDRGTGKSSTVKAILNEFHPQGLRMVEVPKKYLIDFPVIVRQLKGRRQKFILFVDDLAFEDNEENYTALKAALEGGLEAKPANVLIYATSNRRHLIKEKFSDRAGLSSGNSDDEVRAYDNLQEKLSLADRFGITVVFSSPDKKQYLQLVEGIAAQRGIQVDTEYLHKEALKWELWYNGRSPRTARQFVDWLEGNPNK